MGRWKKSKSFNPPTLQGFKRKEGSGPVFNFSDHLIDAIAYKSEVGASGFHFLQFSNFFLYDSYTNIKYTR